MESIAYIITNKFILVAFDGNLNLKADKLDLRLRKIKKAHKTNDTTIVSIVGNLYNMTKLYRYILELCRINKTVTPSQLLEDIKDLYPKGIENLSHFFNQMTDIIQNLQDKEVTEADRVIALQKLQNNSDLKDLLGDNVMGGNPKANLNYVFIFNYNSTDGLNLTTANVAGSFVFETMLPLDKKNIPKNSFFIGLASSTKDENEMVSLRQKYVDELKPIFESSNWEDENKNEDIINTCKEFLARGLNEISPFDDKPEIFFYELGNHTNYIVKTPDVQLTDVNINQ